MLVDEEWNMNFDNLGMHDSGNTVTGSEKAK